MTKTMKCVRFSLLEIIELPYTVGDNPCVKGGAPISASWRVQKRTQFDVDFFETYRPRRRTRSELVLSKTDRKALWVKMFEGGRMTFEGWKYGISVDLCFLTISSIWIRHVGWSTMDIPPEKSLPRHRKQLGSDGSDSKRLFSHDCGFNDFWHEQHKMDLSFQHKKTCHPVQRPWKVCKNATRHYQRGTPNWRWWSDCITNTTGCFCCRHRRQRWCVESASPHPSILACVHLPNKLAAICP